MTIAEEIHYEVPDRSRWPSGPWDDEPDRLEWRHQGVPCLIQRHYQLGNWCGYAAVAPGHPWHGKNYEYVDADAHGGLTYSDVCQSSFGICHIPQPGEPDNVWWLGFDCSHAWDLSPGMMRSFSMPKDVYRDQAYVSSWTEQLAAQIIAAWHLKVV